MSKKKNTHSTWDSRTTQERIRVNEQKGCDTSGCQYKRRTLSRHCHQCQLNKRYFGASTIRRFHINTDMPNDVRRVEKLMLENPGHAGIKAAVAKLQHIIDHPGVYTYDHKVLKLLKRAADIDCAEAFRRVLIYYSHHVGFTHHSKLPSDYAALAAYGDVIHRLAPGDSYVDRQGTTRYRQPVASVKAALGQIIVDNVGLTLEMATKAIVERVEAGAAMRRKMAQAMSSGLLTEHVPATH